MSLHAWCLQVTRLRYTPRKFVVHPDHSTLIVAEADHAAVPAAERSATETGMDTDRQQPEVQIPAFLGHLHKPVSALLIQFWTIQTRPFSSGSWSCRASSLTRRGQPLRSSRAPQRMLPGGGRLACGLLTRPRCRPQGEHADPALFRGPDASSDSTASAAIRRHGC